MARLARIDPELVSPTRHHSEQAQADLIVIRARAVLAEARTMLVNSGGACRSPTENVCEAAARARFARNSLSR